MLQQRLKNQSSRFGSRAICPESASWVRIPIQSRDRVRQDWNPESRRESALTGRCAGNIHKHTLPPSSSGLGHSPLTAKTGVRVPLGVIFKALREIARLFHFMDYDNMLQTAKC